MHKTILITGAGTRIGKALAIGLAEDGWRIAVHYNTSAKSAQDLAASLPTQSIAIGANLNVPGERDTLIERAQAALKTPLSALINNASTYAPDEVRTFTSAGYDHHFNVNIKAPLILSQVFAQALPKGQTGAIINIIDQRVLRPSPDFFTYGLSKSALFAATKTLAQSLAPRIRVNAIGPGPTLANIYQDENDFADEIKSTLLGTGSPPDTILNGVRFLLAARAVTGQMIAIDGGEHLVF